MKAMTRVYLYDEQNGRFFGEGPCRLLHAIDETGSLRKAAAQMDMGYSKALRIIHRAEEALDFPLTEKVIGGTGGGGSTLTEAARVFLKDYEAYRERCCQENEHIYQEIFGKYMQALEKKVGCVIMASGLGKRFGSNKLLEEFQGKLMIEWILDATEGIAPRVVVTRHPEVEMLCKKRQVDVILHDLPGRNDTVRLGLEHLLEKEKDLAGCMFCPSDQPFLTRSSLETMIQMFQKESESIYRLGYEENTGTPVLFPRRVFPELQYLPQGKGGSWLLKQHKDQIRISPADSAYELQDIDTREDWERFSTIPFP